MATGTVPIWSVVVDQNLQDGATFAVQADTSLDAIVALYTNGSLGANVTTINVTEIASALVS